MPEAPAEDPGANHELELDLVLEAPRTAVWRCWTEPALLTRWFTPAPWTTTHAELDVRPGGGNLVVMRSPEGEETPHRGVYLEVVPPERLVLTDAYTADWQPSGKPFMTAILEFAEAGPGRTRYRARVRHWSAEDRRQHEEMGFASGWTQAARQLEAVARTL